MECTRWSWKKFSGGQNKVKRLSQAEKKNKVSQDHWRIWWTWKNIIRLNFETFISVFSNLYDKIVGLINGVLLSPSGVTVHVGTWCSSSHGGRGDDLSGLSWSFRGEFQYCLFPTSRQYVTLGDVVPMSLHDWSHWGSEADFLDASVWKTETRHYLDTWAVKLAKPGASHIQASCFIRLWFFYLVSVGCLCSLSAKIATYNNLEALS